MASGALPARQVRDRVDTFRTRLQSVSGTLTEAHGSPVEAVNRVLNERGLDRVLLAPGFEPGGLDAQVVDVAYARAHPEKVLGLAKAQWGVAASGSVVLEGVSSLLACVLVETAAVLLDERRIVGTLAELPPPQERRAIVTGPARTADIEKKIVLGAHGAKWFHVVLHEGSAVASSGASSQ